jgi:hypothetical protein
MHTINSIKDSVSKLFDVDLSSSKRDTKHFRARSVFYKMCYNLCYKPTLQAIGDSVNKNHATVIHSIKTFENNLKFDPIMRDMYDTIKKLHKYYEGEDVAIPELLKSNELLRNKLAELEESIEQNNIKVVSDYEEISLLNNLLYKLDDDERFLLICKLDALYKLNKNKIK